MIPLKLETLLEGRVVEKDRVEYKRGWNPSEIITTICAYANDFSNVNGGYIAIGIEEKYGRPIFPPIGLDEDDLDEIQKKLFEYCNLITPRYIPKADIVNVQDKHILYLWCSAGDDGPYSAPKDVLSKDAADRHKEYWIKPFSVKTIAKGSELSELFSKFNSVPFDDRVNREAAIKDIRRGHLEDFLRDANSSLAEQINIKPLEDMLVALEVANETDVGISIRNIGLLMFGDRPDKFLPCAQIELIWFKSPEAEGSDDFTEKIFTGPIQKQVRDALSYIEAVILEERVVKYPDRAEADRFWNYPYAALEEILVNSVLHKSYRLQEPIEIRIYVDCIKVINYPGPGKIIDMEKLRAGKASSRHYRNRRIGEFLKEIDLAEKKATGITKILNALKHNGSPPPDFETDEERNYFTVTIRRHSIFEPLDSANEDVEDHVNDLVNYPDGLGNDLVNDPNDPINDLINEPNDLVNNLNDPVSDLVNQTQIKIIRILRVNSSATYDQLANQIGVSPTTIKRHLKKLSEMQLIKRVGSNKVGHWEILK